MVSKKSTTDKQVVSTSATNKTAELSEAPNDTTVSSGRKSGEPTRKKIGRKSTEPPPSKKKPVSPTKKKRIEPATRKLSEVERMMIGENPSMPEKRPSQKDEVSVTENEQTDLETSQRKNKEVKKLHKPKTMKKSAKRLAKEHMTNKESMMLEKEQMRLKKQEMNALQQRRVDRKEAEFSKRLSELTRNNNELKALEEKLSKECEFVKNDRNYKDLELEKLTQFWTITREQLEDQRHQAIDLETRMERIKAVHVEQISLLHKRINMLQLEAKVELVASTQTDPFGKDADCSGYVDETVQTESDWDAQKVGDLLRQHDEELSIFVAELENSKFQVQSDYKYASIQIEQNLREEYEEEIRSIKEEKERQLEEMVRMQSEGIQQIKNEKAHMKIELGGEITKQKMEIQQYVHTLEQKEFECNDLLDRFQASEKQYEGLAVKYRNLNANYERNKIADQTIRKDAKTIGDLRNRLEKIEEINEILLGEFKKLEHERNMFSEQLSYVLKAGGSNRGQGTNASLINVQNKAYEIGEQLDEIRRKYGGLKL